MTEEEKKITIKIRNLVEIEEEVNEIEDFIEIAKSQDWKVITINDNLNINVLRRLEITENIRWYKKGFFKRQTILIWG